MQPAAVARQRAVGADHAVTRNDDRDRIRSVGGADRADRVRSRDAARELGVADRRAVSDPLQLAPARQLELRASRRERKLEVAALAAKYSSSWRMTSRVAPAILPARSRRFSAEAFAGAATRSGSPPTHRRR